MHRALVTACAALLGLTAVTQAAFNPATDFSITNGNPNGVWSYGWTPSLASGYVMTLDTATSTFSTLSTWRGNLTGDGNPTVSYNAGPGFVSGTVTVPANSLVMHPGPGGQPALLRWTAPAAGTYNLSATFTGIDSTTTDVHLLHNGMDLFTGAISGFGSTSSSGVLTFDVALNDTIDIAVGAGGNGFPNDSTAVAASIAVVPEPAALVPLVAGGLLLTRRRR